MAQSEFEKEILSVETIEKSIQNTINLIQKVNPNCTIIFTVSPVRHLKDGFIENQRSKSHLITAIHKIVNYHKSVSELAKQFSIINYFPSYEIMMDELRDYRFYADDMLHPSQMAIDYIWEQFFLSQVDESMFPIMQEVCNIQKALAHRTFNFKSESHQKFVENVNQKINTLAKLYPQIKF